MNIKISKFKVMENLRNEVTSEKLFKPRRAKDKDGNWRFHEKGIFSREIFGSLYSCYCGETKEVGTICESCGTRVISKNNMPDFYISCEIDVPFMNTDYSVFGKDALAIAKLLTYECFLYNAELVEFDIEKLDLTQYDLEDIKIGKDACFALNQDITEEWIQENTFRNIPIPHPMYRPIIHTNDKKYVLTEINEILVDLLDKKSKILSFLNIDELDVFRELAIKNLLYKKYKEVHESIYDLFLSGKKGTIKQEIIGQSLTGAIRAVITNNFDLDEDIIMIGKEHVDILWPNLAKKYAGDVDLINKELSEGEYYVFVNRPPTIGQKSMIAMKPVIEGSHADRFIISTNPIIFDGLAADTDGDQFLVIAMYTKEANQEIKKLLPSKNYIGGNNGRIRNAIPEDFIYTMKKIYKKNGVLRSEIKSIIYDGKPDVQGLSLENYYGFGSDLEEMENIPRENYMKIYKILGENMWENCEIPTVGDLVDLFNNSSNETLDDMTSFFENEDKLKDLLFKEDAIYSEEESNTFMKKVIASNATDISDAGWFYKKLISSCDDIRTKKEACSSSGVLYNVLDINESIYNYKIKFSFVEQIQDYAKYDYKTFMKDLKDRGVASINVRTPITCELTSERDVCVKCAGVIKMSYENYFTPKNFGAYSTLMITEHATQASLDSMNKGTSENINTMLDKKIESKNITIEEMRALIDQIVEEIGDVGVQSRFYEVALRSRFYETKPGLYSASSLQYSFGHQSDPLGCFIYSPTDRNFIKMINSGEFESSSLKSQIMFDIYD